MREEKGDKKKNYLNFAAVVFLISSFCKMSHVSRDIAFKEVIYFRVKKCLSFVMVCKLYSTQMLEGSV